MNIFSKIKHLILRIALRMFSKTLGEALFNHKYKREYGKKLNIDNPQTFHEKLCTRVIRINRGEYPIFTTLADKFLVRDYVRERIDEKYLTKLFWHGNDPKKIPFDELPEKCVFKTNHWSGEIIVFDSSVSREYVKFRMKKLLRANYYFSEFEYQYFKIPPLILVEEFLDDTEYENGPIDYRFWCFDGKPEIIQLDNHKHNIDPFYDTEWNKQAVTIREDYLDLDFRKPDNLNEMLDIAAKLSSGFDFVRVDLYNLRGKIYFGELTFTPRSGMFKFRPEFWDLRLGQKWNFK